jgi:uncharacterized protein YjbJ (UPF0337 family)
VHLKAHKKQDSFNSKRSGKLEMAGLLSQLTGNTMNQIGQATGNKELQIAGFATNQMGLNASAINSFRQKDGAFSTDSKKKQKQKNKNQGQNQNWGQNMNFQPPVNRMPPSQKSPWQNQNQNIDLITVNAPAQNFNPQQNMNPPAQNMSAPAQNFNPQQNMSAPAQNLNPSVQMPKIPEKKGIATLIYFLYNRNKSAH